MSRRTILELINSLNFKTHDTVERFVIEFDLEQVVSGQWIKEKETSISKYLIENGDSKGPSGSSLVVDVIEYLLNNKSHLTNLDKLENCLAKDGYELTETSVRKSLPSAIPLVESENKLLAILEKRELHVAIGHYEQAIAAHGRGEWAAANSQLRSFVEEFFNQCHKLLDIGAATTTQQKKQELESSGFFLKEYNEFLNNGTGFVEGFWKRLHPQGSHPGLSEPADSSLLHADNSKRHLFC